jgi:Fe-S cluster biosynthesis and repair protein YggX
LKNEIKLNLKDNSNRRFLNDDLDLYIGCTEIDEQANKHLMKNDAQLSSINK